MIHTLDRQNSKDSLLIFDSFEIDMNLPKHKKGQEAVKAVTPTNQPGVFNMAGTAATGSVFLYTGLTSATTLQVYNGGMVAMNPIVDQMSQQYANNGVFARLYRWWNKVKEEKKLQYDKKIVQYVFDCVLTQPEKLAKFDEKNNAYDVMIANAKALGQVALAEQLEADTDDRKFENACLACNVDTALTEAQLLKFADKCEKGLKLDWIKNFARVIPQEAIDKKLAADEACLFDNYVVLYYDPENKCTKLTKADIEKKKDPILFGVMRGNRKLYFIHDWKDHLCDLTMREVVDTLGKKENLSLELP